MIEDYRKQLKDLEFRKNQLEKEIAASNAKHEAQLDMLRKEYSITNEEEIAPLIESMESKLEEDKKKLNEFMNKLTNLVSQLEKIVNG